MSEKQEVSGFPEATLPTPLPTPNAKLSPSTASSQDTAVPVEGLIDDVRGKVFAVLSWGYTGPTNEHGEHLVSAGPCRHTLSCLQWEAV